MEKEPTDRISGHDLHVGVRRLQHDVQHVKIAVGNQLQPLRVAVREEHLCDLQCHTRVTGGQGGKVKSGYSTLTKSECSKRYKAKNCCVVLVNNNFTFSMGFLKF